MAGENEETKIYILNTGGTLGMAGNPAKGIPLRPAKTAKELLEGIRHPEGVELTFEEFDRQDSTNITYGDRVRMAEKIRDAYPHHDAFVVFHGTDSLPETAAAFCMIFKASFRKPLFVIGAQMTKDEPGTDVSMQIENTLRAAQCFHRNGLWGAYNVCLNDVWDGSRLVKRADSDIYAFHTPGRDSIAKAYPRFYIRYPLVYLRRNSPRIWGDSGGQIERIKLRFDPYFERQVATIKVSADTPPDLLIDAVERRQLKGVILECKGAGNLPDRQWGGKQGHSWIDAVRIATQHGVPVGVLSPFEDGRVIFQRYSLGYKAQEAGAISLETLTPPMADAKFRHFVGWPGMVKKNSKGRFEILERLLSLNFTDELVKYREEMTGEEWEKYFGRGFMHLDSPAEEPSGIHLLSPEMGPGPLEYLVQQFGISDLEWGFTTPERIRRAWEGVLLDPRDIRHLC